MDIFKHSITLHCNLLCGIFLIKHAPSNQNMTHNIGTHNISIHILQRYFWGMATCHKILMTSSYFKILTGFLPEVILHFIIYWVFYWPWLSSYPTRPVLNTSSPAAEPSCPNEYPFILVPSSRTRWAVWAWMRWRYDRARESKKEKERDNVSP